MLIPGAGIERDSPFPSMQPAALDMLESIYRKSPISLQNVLLNAEAFRIRVHRYGSAYRKSVTELLAREHWSSEQIEDFQDERLRQLVRYAYEHTRFYRQSLKESGIDPLRFRGREDLPKLPLVTKEDLRSRPGDFMTRKRPLRGWLNGHTSGTTGSPLSLWYDRVTCILTNAVDRRQKVWAGMREKDWIALVLGRVIVPPRQRKPPFWRVNHVQKQLWLSSFHMSPENLGDYIREIRRRQIRFVEGYPSTLFVLAKHLLNSGERLPMSAVITSSETLHTVQRSAIETAFDCELFDFYAQAERVVYAGECNQHEGKHVAEDYGFSEVVDAHGRPCEPGQSGFLVGTSLFNRAMPLIRYRTDDISSLLPDSCPCGRSFRRITDVTTKAEDLVVTPDGRFISPSVLTHPFKPLHGVVKSQIVQTARDEIVVKVVPQNTLGTVEEMKLRRALQDRLGSDVSVDIQIVEDIPNEPSGKFRWVISHVDHDRKLNWE